MGFPQTAIVNRSTIKPIYLIVVEDQLNTDGITYYKSQDISECNIYLEFRGFELTKTQAAKSVKDPYAQLKTGKPEIKAVNRKIPWHRVIRIENLTYNKSTPQGENQ